MITGDFEGSFLRALVEGSGQLPYTATVQSPLEIPPTKTFDFFLVSMKKKQTNLSSILPSLSLSLSLLPLSLSSWKKKKKKNSTIHDSITRCSTSQFRSRWIVKKERGKRKAFEFRILSFSLFIVSIHFEHFETTQTNSNGFRSASTRKNGDRECPRSNTRRGVRGNRQWRYIAGDNRERRRRQQSERG